MVPAICTQCGAQIEVDNTHEAGVCKHCGTAFITEKAINNYTTYVTNNNNFAGATFIQEDGFQKLVNAAEGYLKIGDLSGAKTVYQNIINDYPQKFEGWYGLWCLEIEEEKKRKRQTNNPLKSRYLENAKKLASGQQITILNETINNYTNLYRASVERARKAYNSKFGLFENFVSYVRSHSALKTSCDASSIIFYKNGKLIYEIVKRDNDGALVESYEYTFVGYNSNNNTFEFSNTVTIYDFYPKKHIKSKLNYCNLKLIAEDYSDDNIINYYESGNFGDIFNFYFREIVDGREYHRFFSDEFTIGYSGNSSSSGCYIATCVYGSYDCPEVWTLRRFRDYTLDETWYGRAFVKCYYAVSPTLVKWFGNDAWFVRFWKKVLDNFVKRLNSRGVENTKYQDKY